MRKKIPKPKILCPLITLLLLTACVEIHIDADDGDWDKVKVDGEVLENKRTIHLIEDKNYGKFDVDVHHGNIKLTGGSNYDLEIEVYENVPDDVTLFIEKGILTGKTKSGDPYAIGKIAGTLPQNASIIIDNGAGNITIRDIQNENATINIDIGAGNVDIRDCTVHEIDIDNGAGNFDIAYIRAEEIDIDVGAGNIDLNEVISREIVCDTGVGNIKANKSAAHHIDLDTGVGNISVHGCQFREERFSTGIGRVNKSGNTYLEKPEDEWEEKEVY